MKKKLEINTELPVSILREGDSFVAYSPALDISTAGKTYTEVQTRFKELVEIFFEELKEMGTLNETLENLGWVKKKSRMVSPFFVSHNMMSVSIFNHNTLIKHN